MIRSEMIRSELSSIENSSKLRRSADLENLNELYSTIVERFDEIDGLLEGKVLNFELWSIPYYS